MLTYDPCRCRLGVLPAEQAAPLKLLEKGVSKEALAGLVLLEFPCELLSAVLAGRWELFCAAQGAARPLVQAPSVQAGQSQQKSTHAGSRHHTPLLASTVWVSGTQV